MQKLYTIKNAAMPASFLLVLLLLPFFASSQVAAVPLGGQLYGEQIVSGPYQLTSGCNGIGGNLSVQTKFVATAKSVYQADNSVIPDSYSKQWTAPAGRRIENMNVKKKVSNDSCWQDYLLLLLDNGTVYVYNPATGTAVSYGQAGSGNPQSFFKVGGDDIYVLSSSYLYTTVDSGATWQVDTAGLSGAMINDFAVDSTQRVYAATNNGIFEKSPSDSAWIADTSFNAISYVAKIFIDRSNRIFAAGGGNGLIYSNFGSDTGWVADSAGFGPYVVKEFADDDSGNIYTVANNPFTTSGDKIYKSDSGTGMWYEIDGLLSLLNSAPVTINSISGDSVLNLGTNLGIYISPDLGNTWPAGNNTGIQAEYVEGLVQLPNDSLIVTVSLGVYVKTASGAVWQKTYPANGYANGLSIYSDSAGTIYLRDPNITPPLQQATSVLNSTDNGLTWAHDFAGLSAVSGNYYFVDETGAQHYANSFYADDVYSLLWVKPTGGNWGLDTVGFPVDTNSAITAMASDHSGYLYVSGYLNGAGVWRRAMDSASAWMPDVAGLNNNVSGFYQMAGNHGMMLGSSSYQIFLNVDSIWINVPFPPQDSGYRVSAISVDSKGTIFAAFSSPSNIGAGVYLTKDTGATWYSAGLDSIDVTALVSYTDTTYALTGDQWAYIITLSPSLGIGGPLAHVLPLLNTYPEPFGNAVTIQYSLPVQSLVSVQVYDVTGQELGTLKNEAEQPGSYTLTWNTNDVPDGVYFCKMLATGTDGRDYSRVARMMRLK